MNNNFMWYTSSELSHTAEVSDLLKYDLEPTGDMMSGNLRPFIHADMPNCGNCYHEATSHAWHDACNDRTCNTPAGSSWCEEEDEDGNLCSCGWGTGCPWGCGMSHDTEHPMGYTDQPHKQDIGNMLKKVKSSWKKVAGYNTWISGSAEIHPPLNQAERDWLDHLVQGGEEPQRVFNENTHKWELKYDKDAYPWKEVGNIPSEGQPQWTHDQYDAVGGSSLKHDENDERAYGAHEHLQHVIDHFLRPDGHAKKLKDKGDKRFKDFTFDHNINGEFYAQGEQSDDSWMLKVKNNQVTRHDGHVVYDEDGIETSSLFDDKGSNRGNQRIYISPERFKPKSSLDSSQNIENVIGHQSSLYP